MDESDNRRRTWLICAGLALAVAAAYWPIWHCGFVEFDDNDYVFNNAAIRHGLNWRAIVWAFTTFHASNWHPLTWISHMVDVQLYGLSPAGHHASSQLLHIANSILLFLLLKRLTRAVWPAAVTAALFALHPMHVESVAWVSERKDVLSTFFWMLSVWSYVRFAEESRLQSPKSNGFYAGSLVFFALALMCKPMVVTLPFLLLLLDYWPLERLRGWPARVWMEKIPFLILAAAAAIVTVVAQREGKSMLSLTHLSMAMRVENLPIGYARYVGKLFWPRNLVILYPYPPEWPAWEIAGTAIFLAAVTLWVCRRAHSQPFLLMGWLWFLIGLAPVNGLMQTGVQSIADRYTYVPSIGLFIMVVWSFRQFGRRAAVLAIAVLVTCFSLTARQVGYWKDTKTLFAHATENTTGNYITSQALGQYLALHGERAKGIEYMEKAVTFAPWFAPAQNDLGRLLFDEGRMDEALPHLEQAVALKPSAPESHYNLGNALLAKGRVAEALDQFQRQVSLNPDDAVAERHFGTVLLDNNLINDAIPILEKAVLLNPSDAAAHFQLGNAYFRRGSAAGAVSQYEKALQIEPDNYMAGNNLAWILASSPAPGIRNGPLAVELASRADQLTGRANPVIAGTLAVAFAECGKFPDAITTAKRARQLAQAQKNLKLVQSTDEWLKLFRAGLPFRDVISPPQS
jgi:Flp pilus assembly protein TadD